MMNSERRADRRGEPDVRPGHVHEADRRQRLAPRAAPARRGYRPREPPTSRRRKTKRAPLRRVVARCIVVLRLTSRLIVSAHLGDGPGSLAAMALLGDRLPC